MPRVSRNKNPTAHGIRHLENHQVVKIPQTFFERNGIYQTICLCESSRGAHWLAWNTVLPPTWRDSWTFIFYTRGKICTSTGSATSIEAGGPWMQPNPSSMIGSDDHSAQSAASIR